MSANWLTAKGWNLTFDAKTILRSTLSTVLVGALGVGGFAGAFFGLGSRPVSIDRVELNEATVRAIASEAMDTVDREVRALEKIADGNALLIQATSERLDRSEAIQVDNLRILNRLLGRLESGESIGRKGPGP